MKNKLKVFDAREGNCAECKKRMLLLVKNGGLCCCCHYLKKEGEK